jgi:pimeloyl-ACP methyl ester carboxylesterase
MTPTVLIPGLACTAELFAAQIPALWRHGPVTVASTLEGETIADMAAAILRDAPPRFALGGLSMGGYIALEIMRQAPERVVKLALLDTAARPDTPEQSTQRRALMARAEAGELEAVLRQIAPNLLHPDHRADPALIETQVRMGLAVGAEGFVRQQNAIIGRIDSRPHLADIKVPTLVLVGDKDALTPPDRSEEMAAAIPDARLVVIPECGHASTLEQPEAVSRALIDWLSA